MYVYIHKYILYIYKRYKIILLNPFFKDFIYIYIDIGVLYIQTTSLKKKQI